METNKNYRIHFGPLQPSKIFSFIHKIPAEEIERVANDIGILLPKKINFSEFHLDKFPEKSAQKTLEELRLANDKEEYLLQFLNKREEKRKKQIILRQLNEQDCPFEYIDLSNNDKINYSDLPETAPSMIRAIGYLQDLIEKYRNGEVQIMTTIALLKNGKASIWLPGTFDQEELDEIYQPLIDALKEGKEKVDIN